ncbi:glycoside hydrolase family 13 protein [Psychrosphaera sp. B3R10]|uniref:glycoside hydrolase family 13 protein n=1 Tax=unclassified Psychrosphaera TaxID=2641570 RepID=UPI001C08B325|nr:MULTISPECIES: glycoside hydrolase family 13 protein [unclassified Psychrosphaera]MBU2883596.1 glycoside hydrolase family 13 protein [Psychrosphaera sp. I2R16]MBU2989774.1 glycoside hydrolase family 13 protein [Psychrosphaera sp. B3R10]
MNKFTFAIIPLLVIVIPGCNSIFLPKSVTTENSNISASQQDDRFSKEFVPQWAKSAIWYQIFPERFRNGDVTNDPQLIDAKGADPAEPAKTWELHPWGSDWYKLQEYETTNGEPELWKHLLRRRYGGDLQGVIDQLPYLQDLGINAIYLNPIFDSPSLHKYDAVSYHHVSPNFGPDPIGDRKLIDQENPLDPDSWVWTSADELALKLIADAHKMGIKIIFDGVFNHMGVNSFAFKNLMQHQEKSPFKDWFIVHSFDDKEAGTTFDYEGWFGVKSLPEFKEDENGLVQGPKDYVFAATERWMNPKGKGAEYGIDGWRLDVAFCIAHQFWKDWRVHVKSLNPDAYLTAEIVDTPDNVKPYMQGDEFDGEMNYNFAFAASEFFFNPENIAITATEFDQKLAELRTLYPAGVAYTVQNLFGSHDSNRIGSHIVNRGIGNFRDWAQYFNLSQAGNNRDYNVRKPNEQEINLQKLFVTLQMTYVGAPMIYYGDEVGMWGGNDPDSRKPMIWSDINYQDEITNPDGSHRAPDKVSANLELREHYKKMITLRNSHPALSVGDYQTLVTDDKNGILAFQRQFEDETIWVIINNSGEAQTVNISSLSFSKARNLTTLDNVIANNGYMTIAVQPKSGAVFKVK